MQYALSLKQPWAALLVHGMKTIEVRKWPTARRGSILIHAARISDERTEAWNWVPAELGDMPRLVGGFIGRCELTGCFAYRSKEAFAKDRARHLNEADWFEPPLLYGFTLKNAEALSFRAYPGWMRFFPVEDDVLAPRKGARGK